MPIIGDGSGYWSFLHIDDAAAATLAALDARIPGLYNVADDEPAPAAKWLPFLANILGANPPMHIPAWLARILVGPHGMAMMTQIRGASNRKAKALLGWTLKWPSWREGFREGLGSEIREAQGSSPMPVAG
jgi:nucleoside-diphosphate-sugar epimerase